VRVVVPALRGKDCTDESNDENEASKRAVPSVDANAAVEAVKTFKLCFQDDNVPYGVIDLFNGGSASTVKVNSL
jgi:hypothetical protein